MNGEELTRRDFHTLTAAAFGGLVAGTVAGCGKKDKTTPAPKTPKTPKTKTNGDGTSKETTHDVMLLAEEPHVCRGLNTCKGQGATKDNDCAGAGACATAEKHTCHKENKCKGQGGCGEYPGQNTCKATGACGVPLKGHDDGTDTWAKARKAFEEAWMKKTGKAPQAAPAKKPS